MINVFIDGRNGTTGLKIDERLSKKNDVNLIVLPENKRKDCMARKEALNSADVVFLCLPDDASREAVSMISNKDVIVIDTSTAHRTNPDWAYGFPELDACFEEKIKNSKRIAVPGCHASGFIALIYPLIKEGILDRNELLNCISLTGYSGGGKKKIAEYESAERNHLLDTPRIYGIDQNHKHLPEMTSVCSLIHQPVFAPIICDFFSGMQVCVPISRTQLKFGDINSIKEIYKNLYNSKIVYYNDEDETGFLSTGILSGKDSMMVGVYGNEDRILLTARYDNLGKGASGAAIECLNIVTNKDKTDTLIL